jgi:hypothetical protein
LVGGSVRVVRGRVGRLYELGSLYQRRRIHVKWAHARIGLSIPTRAGRQKNVRTHGHTQTLLCGVEEFEFQFESSLFLLYRTRRAVAAVRIDAMQQKPEAMEEEERPEALKAAAAMGPDLGFWAAARRRLAPDDPFFAAGDLERELLAKHVSSASPPPVLVPMPSPPLLFGERPGRANRF